MSLNTLPGVKAEIIDGQLRPRFVPTQPKVTLIGTTNNPDAVVGEPTRIDVDADLMKVDNFFLADGVTPSPSGPVRKPSELSRAIAEARNGGAEHVEYVVLPDPTATNLFLEITPTNKRRYDSQAVMYTLLKESPIDIVVPVNSNIDATGLSLGENMGYELANFCHQATINERSALGVIGTTPPVAGNAIPTLAQTEAWVAGLETFDTSSVLGAAFTEGDGITDAGADGTPDNYAFWATTDENIPTGTPPRYDAQVESERRGAVVDIGKYLSVTTETVRFINEVSNQVDKTNGFYHGNIAAAYAGLVASLPSRIGTTNKVLGGTTPVRALSPSQVERLQTARFVAMRIRPTGYLVNNGITFAHRINDVDRSDFTQLTTLRITQDALSFVRSRAIEFIGQPNNAEAKNALQADIDDALRIMQRLGALNRYDFNIQVNPAQATLGRMVIELTIVPAFEITTITVAIALARE